MEPEDLEDAGGWIVAVIESLPYLRDAIAKADMELATTHAKSIERSALRAEECLQRLVAAKANPSLSAPTA